MPSQTPWPRLVLLLLAALPFAACESDPSGGAPGDVVEAEAFSCPSASVTWAATKGTCPLLDEAFEIEIQDCEVQIESRDGLDANGGAPVSWSGVFDSPTTFGLDGGPNGWSCSGGWSGASADLTCETDGGAVCVATLEAPCEDVSGVWRVTVGMCFDFEATFTLEQGPSCDLRFLEGEAVSDDVPEPALVDGSSVSFVHSVHGSCVGAIVAGSFKGQCDGDGCTFEMTRRQ